jgi:hypothetical protein
MVGEPDQGGTVAQHVGGKGFVIALVVAEEGEPIVGQHRRAVTEAGQLGVGEPEQVGDAHGVEHTAPGRLRGCQIGVPVKVEQADGGVLALGTGHNAEGDGAVASQDQR